MKAVLCILTIVITLGSCNFYTEQDLIGTYTETHKCFKDSIWLLPNGDFLQKIYGRNGNLIYKAKSKWRIYSDEISIDNLSSLPPKCDDVDTLYQEDLQGGPSSMLVSKRKEGFAIYIPIFIEVEEGIYFYKVESEL